MSPLETSAEDGSTPLDEGEAEELIPDHITTVEQLNEWEQENILRASLWVPITRGSALDEATIRELHRRMFDRTWRWAGRYRLSDKSIGIPWPEVPTAVRNLVEDGRYWLEHGTFPIREAAARLHHRLVLIHPFPNGNGRLSRLWSDMLLQQHGEPRFNWRGAEDRSQQGPDRRAYIAGLKQADSGEYGDLLAFLGIEP